MNIASISRSQRFNMPVLRIFDGKTDLEEHVFHYIQKMGLETDNEFLMCRLFSSSSIGLALNRFVILNRTLYPIFKI